MSITVKNYTDNYLKVIYSEGLGVRIYFINWTTIFRFFLKINISIYIIYICILVTDISNVGGEKK